MLVHCLIPTLRKLRWEEGIQGLDSEILSQNKGLVEFCLPFHSGLLSGIHLNLLTFYFFFKDLFNLLYIYIYEHFACIYVCVLCACLLPIRGAGFLELELQKIVSH